MCKKPSFKTVYLMEHNGIREKRVCDNKLQRRREQRTGSDNQDREKIKKEIQTCIHSLVNLKSPHRWGQRAMLMTNCNWPNKRIQSRDARQLP